MPYNNNGTDKNGLIGIDAPRVNPDVAVELMTHHLQLAAAYFEATPEDFKAVRAEVIRIMQLNAPSPDYITPEMAAAAVWLTNINAYHERLKREFKRQGLT